MDPELAKDKVYIDACLKDSEQIQDEDIWLCERVQKGLNSSAYNYGGRYSAVKEGGEYLFHQLLNKDLEAAVAAGGGGGGGSSRDNACPGPATGCGKL